MLIVRSASVLAHCSDAQMRYATSPDETIDYTAHSRANLYVCKYWGIISWRRNSPFNFIRNSAPSCNDKIVTEALSDFEHFRNKSITASQVGRGLSDKIAVNPPDQIHSTNREEFSICSDENVLSLYDAQEVINPYLDFGVDGDTLFLCANKKGVVSVLNEDGSVPDNIGLDWAWSISPFGQITGSQEAEFGVPTSGWYHFEAQFGFQQDTCPDQDQSFTLTDSLYIKLNPTPVVSAGFTGPQIMCPGDTAVFYANPMGGEIVYNFTPYIDFGDSLYVLSPGFYTATVSNTNQFGCSSSTMSGIELSSVSPPQLNLQPSSGVLCPEDSIKLLTTDLGTVVWHLPNGMAMPDSNILFVQEVGLYSAAVSYHEGCTLFTNTVEVTPYTTPFISTSSSILCQGDSVELQVITSDNSVVEWQNPLNGYGNFQIVDMEGLYTAIVHTCNITTELSIDLAMNSSVFELGVADTAQKCEGDGIQVIATSGYSNYTWNPSGTGTSNYYDEDMTVQAFAIDSNGCELISNMVNIAFKKLPPAPEFNLNLVCYGQDQTVSIESNYSSLFTTSNGISVGAQGPSLTIPNFINDTTLYAYLYIDNCRGPIDSVTLGPKALPLTPQISGDSPICTGEVITLAVTNPSNDEEYYWFSPLGNADIGSTATFPVASSLDQGFYQCFAKLNGCSGDTSLIAIDILLTRQVELPNDSTLCSSSEVILSADTLFRSYAWSDGSGESSILPTQSGNYHVYAIDFNGCESFDEIYLEILNCDVVIPNVFTPNGDGRNDLWQISTFQPLSFHVQVFDRWGVKVFESNKMSEMWNGHDRISGQSFADGVYFYNLDIRNYDNVAFSFRGSVMLIRD